MSTQSAGTAVLSRCGSYRYRLARTWDPALPAVLWIMLNPSTADALTDDPTIRRCVGFARTWGAGGLVVVNLFALRATNPAALRAHTDPVGPDNDAAIAAALDARPLLVIAAWGTHGGLHGRDRRVLALARGQGVHPLCLGTTRGGHPRHPLYISADTPAVPYAWQPEEADRG